MAKTLIADSSKSTELISFEAAMAKLSRGDRFRATVYSMNTLLVQKGIYSPEEFEMHFRQFAQKKIKQPSRLLTRRKSEHISLK